MTKIRNFIAILVCRLLIKIGRLMGKNGSSLPGSVAMKISPNLLRYLGQQVKNEIILVCGTNGKTTTNNLLYSLLSHDGSKVVCNNVGANMLPGVACSFISRANIFGKLDADWASLECDEASVRHIAKHIKADKILITNLFRDQSDRYGEIENTAKLLKEAIDLLPEAILVLNADDPFSAHLATGRRAIYFGISENALGAEHTSQLCPLCEGTLEYEYMHYNQLGKYKCTKCTFERTNPNYSATRVSLGDKLGFVVSYKGVQHKLSLNYKGFYNIYNLLASFAAYESSGGNIDDAKIVFDAYKPQTGRMESFLIDGKEVVLNLAKNPAGFNQALETALWDKRSKTVLVAVNDMASDGTDISWLWDTEFEKLCSPSICEIYTSGTRRDDLALRLKYAGIENITHTDITADNIKKIVAGTGEVCYLIVNYTVLFETQSILKALEGK